MRLYVDRPEGEKARKMSILPVVGGARTQFASNYEETDTNDRPLVPPPKPTPGVATL